MSGLTAWQEKYALKLKQGMQHAEILSELNIDQGKYQHSVRTNEVFKTLVEKAGGTGVLCYTELERLRVAQVSEKRSAGYFGMSVEAFKEALEKDPELQEVYHTAPLKGQAQIQMWQFESAERDGDMQKWLGKNYLEQADKIETKTTVEAITDPRELAKMMAFLDAKLEYANRKTIDITPTHLEPEEVPLAITVENSDTETGND